MSNSPNAGIPYVPQGTLDPAAGLNLAIDVIDALLQTAVIDMSLTAPPGGESDGDLYIVGSSATGDWAGQDDNLARYVSEGDFWQFFDAGTQVKMVRNRADGNLYVYDIDSASAGWTVFAGGSGGNAAVSHGPFSSVSISSGAAELDLTDDGIFELILTENLTDLTIANLTTGEANFFTLRVVQDGTGGWTFAVPATWMFASGAGAYVASTGAGDIDLLQGISYDDGASWMVSYLQDFG